MPLAVDSLTPDSGAQTVREAISQSIAACMKEPAPEGTDNQQQYCAGKCYGIARSKTGKSLSEGTVK